MKVAIPLFALITILAGCSTSNQSNMQSQDASYLRQAASAKHAIEQAPSWMFELPKDPNMIFESATSTSSDFSMADTKARTIAFSKICNVAGGKVRSQTKLYRSDNNASSTEQSEMAIRSICPDIDITGVQTIALKHVAEGNMIRTYVLVGLPTGSNNSLKNSKEAQKRAPDAFKELDSLVSKPLNKAVSVQTESEGAPGTLQLLDVNNEDYKRRRDETLQKPNSVIGHATVDGR